MGVNHSRKIHIATIFGTRPEAIKMAPVIKMLDKQKKYFRSSILVTAQHREMLDQVMSLFNIKADIDLDIMLPNQAPLTTLTEALKKITLSLQKLKPDLVLVQGDTTTTLAGALAAFYSGIPVGHIEAGLRTNDLGNPFPEEGNRKMVTAIANWHFAATVQAKQNLLNEKVPIDRIFVTGNPVVDALGMMRSKSLGVKDCQDINFLSGKQYVIITAHRRENFGKPMLGIIKAVQSMAKQNKDYQFVFPVHRNPAVQSAVRKVIPIQPDNLILIKPVGYHQFVHLLKGAQLVLTDSGGIQEEASVFGIKTLVMRRTTERPEALEAGAQLVLPEYQQLLAAVNRALKGKITINKTACPFGDGKAADRIVQLLAWIYKKQARRPRLFIVQTKTQCP